MREVNVGSPQTKHIFMYRNPVNTISSFSDLIQKSSSFLRKLFKKGLKDDIILKQLVFPELDNNHMRLQVEDTIENDDSVHFSTLMFIVHIDGVPYVTKNVIEQSNSSKIPFEYKHDHLIHTLDHVL